MKPAFEAVKASTSHSFVVRRFTEQRFSAPYHYHPELVSTDKSISQVCFDSGFNDVSNFHRTFKAKVNISPLQYRNTFRKKL